MQERGWQISWEERKEYRDRDLCQEMNKEFPQRENRNKKRTKHGLAWDESAKTEIDFFMTATKTEKNSNGVSDGKIFEGPITQVWDEKVFLGILYETYECWPMY